MRVGRRVRALCACAALAASFAAPPLARAQEPSPSARGDAKLVTLSITGAAEDSELLAFTIGELLGRIGVRVSNGEDAPLSSIVAHVRVDATAASGVAVSVTDHRGRAVLARTISRDASPAITREGVAHAVQSAVEATMLREPPPPPPPPVPAVAPPAAAPPVQERPPQERAPRYALDVTTFIGGGPVSKSSGVAPRVGAWLTGRSEGWLRPGLTLGGAYAFPFESADDLVTARTSVTALRAFASVELVRGSDVSLEAGLGGGVDVLSVSARSDVLPSSLLGKPTTRLDGIATGLLTARLALFRGASMMISAGADGDLSTRDYVVMRGASSSALLSPWRVRPVVLIGFSFTALGAARFDDGGAR